MRDFIAAATDGLYIPPTRTLIAGELLDQQYTAVQTQVEALLQSQDKLNFVLDESPNISSRRIVNFSAVIPGYGSIYLSNEDVGREDLDTGYFTDWFIKQASKYDLSRVSSLTTDTCATMRSTWLGLEAVDELSHVLFIPCDSHGLQLLIKDLLDQPRIAEVMTMAQTIVYAFHRAKKQYAILRSKQEKPSALLLAVITRWGTQLMLVTSILQCKSALFAWVGDPKAQMGAKKGENSLSSIITDHTFWTDLSSIEQIIRPIHNAQKMSESDGSVLSKVVPRWLKLEVELRQLTNVYPTLMGEFMSPGGPFVKRAKKQIIDIHYTALLLDPISLLKRPGQLDVDRGIRFLLGRCKEEDKKGVHNSFLEFRTRGGVFGSSHPATLHHDNPIAFWKSYLFDETHSLLSRLSIRIFEATVKPGYKNTLGTTNHILIEEVFLYRGRSRDQKIRKIRKTA